MSKTETTKPQNEKTTQKNEKPRAGVRVRTDVKAGAGITASDDWEAPVV